MELNSKIVKLCKPIVDNWLEQLVAKNSISEVENLNSKITDSAYLMEQSAVPMLFSGNLMSEIVFVELNPKRGLLDSTINDSSIQLDKFTVSPKPKIYDFDSYIDFFSNFGKIKMNEMQARNPTKSNIKPTDRKQLDFLSGFGAFTKENEKYTSNDVIKVRNEKLQLEIVPYMSDNFSFKCFSESYLKRQIELIQNIINAVERKIVFFSGSSKYLEDIFDIKYKAFEIEGKKRRVYIGIKEEANVKYCFIKSYKSPGFVGKHMVEYGRIVKEELNKHN